MKGAHAPVDSCVPGNGSSVTKNSIHAWMAGQYGCRYVTSPPCRCATAAITNRKKDVSCKWRGLVGVSGGASFGVKPEGEEDYHCTAALE